jgi:hypothetical protein
MLKYAPIFLACKMFSKEVWRIWSITISGQVLLLIFWLRAASHFVYRYLVHKHIVYTSPIYRHLVWIHLLKASSLEASCKHTSCVCTSFYKQISSSDISPLDTSSAGIWSTDGAMVLCRQHLCRQFFVACHNVVSTSFCLQCRQY